MYLDKNPTECDPESEFQCANGECIALSDYCNGEPNCLDGDDEQNCLPKKIVSVLSVFLDLEFQVQFIILWNVTF